MGINGSIGANALDVDWYRHDGGIFDTSAFGTGEVYIYVRPELSGIRHNLDQNYQLSFSS